MFKRRDSQKPPDDLYANFKATWNSGLVVTTASPTSVLEATHVTSNVLNASVDSQSYGNLTDSKDLNAVPRAHMEDWKFSPQYGEQHSSTYTNFYNPFHGVFTPTPGGTTLYHSQAAGDLHGQNMNFGIGTPVSHSNSAGGVFQDHSPLNLADPHLMSMSPRHFQNTTGFGGHPPFTSSNFQPDLSSFDHDQQSLDVSTQHMATGVDHDDSLNLLSSHRSHEQHQPVRPANDHFRFQVSLNAATAMVKTPDEIPITYLNKGQAYSISIIDTALRSRTLPRTKYRTFVRVSFEDEQQRVRPGTCWQLWREGRGMNEAHLRGGKLQAVEHVQTTQGDPEYRPYGPHVESESFDGFSVTWSSKPDGSAECSLAVRFNFLSTDFSHSKGVKGIPVRLCAKTEVIDSQPEAADFGSATELCYCKVKLFRDHGAERKLSNDIAHVKKSMEKLKHQIVQLEAGGKDTGKRKRTSSMAGLPSSSRPAKTTKHKRSDSTSSDSSSGVQVTPEEDLHLRLAALQAMFTSTSPISLLCLQGEKQDDPDLYPVSLKDMPPALPTGSSHDSTQKSLTSAPSPSPGFTPSRELHDARRKESAPPSGAPRISPEETSAAKASAGPDERVVGHSLTNSPNLPLKVQVPSGLTSNAESQIIQVLDVDMTYVPPPPRLTKPAACFYIKHQNTESPPVDDYYRAVYLDKRTLTEFITATAGKFDLDENAITGAVWINKNGLKIRVDDSVIQDFPEGQDMIVHCAKPSGGSAWHFLDTDPADDEAHFPSGVGMELILQA